MTEAADDADAGLGSPLCTFWLGGRCLGLDVSLVGEVVALVGTTPVPRAHAAVRGIFNLRGAPVVVLDLADVLQLGEHPDTIRPTVGLLLRAGDITAAGQIDRMDSVIPAGRGELVDRDPDDHAAVLGFLDDRDSGGGVVTVLDPAVLVQRLRALRYVDDTVD